MKIAALPKWQQKVLIPIEYLPGCKLDTLRCNTTCPTIHSSRPPRNAKWERSTSQNEIKPEIVDLFPRTISLGWYQTETGFSAMSIHFSDSLTYKTRL